jgi:hypothetical protein
MKTLLFSILVSLTLSVTSTYAQWKGTIKHENDVMIVENTEHGLWEKKKTIKFKEVLTIGTESEGYLALPWDMTTDTEGNIYVTDFLDHCIKIYNSQGKFLQIVSREGKGPGEVVEVKQIALVSGNKICVCEELGGQGNEVEIFSTNGQPFSSFQTKEIEDDCDLAVSLNGDKIFLTRSPKMYLGTKYMEKSGIDLSYLICSYDLNGNLLGKFGKFEDLEEIEGQKYYSERTHIATLSNGDIVIAFKYPYIVNIYTPEGKHKLKISRKNNIFQGMKIEKTQMMSRTYLRFVPTAEVKNILSLPGNILMVVIYNSQQDSYVYDFFNYEGYFLQSFQGDKRFDYIDGSGFIYDVLPKADVPVIKKYEMKIFW